MATVPDRATDSRRKMVVTKVTDPKSSAFGGYHVEDINNANDKGGIYHMTNTAEQALKNHYEATVGKGMGFSPRKKRKRK